MYANVLHTNRNITSQQTVNQHNNLIDICTMSLLIGEKIKSKIQEKGWTTARFAKEANMSYRNAMHLFKRDDISVDQLLQISKVLQYDFMQDFRTTIPNSDSTVKVLEEPGVYNTLPKDFTTMIISLTIGGEQNTFDRLPELLRKFRKNAVDLGFKVM
jgi:transcriptional regulator with XRE-family HTH domain